MTHRDYFAGACDLVRLQYQTEKPLVTICAWCPDAQAKTAIALAGGFRVSHAICETCAARMGQEETK